MQEELSQLIENSKSFFTSEELKIIFDSVNNQDYNLVRYIIEDIVENAKNSLLDKALTDIDVDTNTVSTSLCDFIKQYKSLKELDDIINMLLYE